MALSRPIDLISKTPGPQMGLRPIPRSDWLLIGPTYAERMAYKKAQRQNPALTQFAELGDCKDAQQECLDMIGTYLVSRYPQGFCLQGKTMHCPDRRSQNLGEASPLDVAGQLVEEDLCLMLADSAGAWRLRAASLASPSHWRLTDKLGLELLDIHNPVPTLRDRIGARMRHFFDHLQPNTLFARGNWFVNASPEWRRDPGDAAQPIHGRCDLVEETLYLRLERQTLLRAPNSGGILFTILVLIEPLSRLAQDPELAMRILHALEVPGVLQYRVWETPHLREPLMDYLRKQCE